jgi:hypothetical protein
VRSLNPVLAFLFVLSVLSASLSRASSPRTEQLLSANWRTILAPAETANFEQPSFDDSTWPQVSIPHNHDTYHGYRQLRHGNLHTTAWYRRAFKVDPGERGRRIFLFFEGVGSYATVWVNGKYVGQHAGGLTTFTLDITDAVTFDRDNLLAVRADHPAGIRDLPWICGGCERTYGTSEGPQPLGVIRPVHLITTAPVRIEPFGVHAWIDGPQSETVKLRVDTSIKNYRASSASFTLRTRLLDHTGKLISESISESSDTTRRETLPPISKPRLWSPADPYLYSLVSEILANNQVIDRLETPFGFRWVSWPKTSTPDRRRFLLNGEPLFLNGTADYEHQLGANFAFSDTQINARVSQIKAAGFNAFRDAHHPHNLRFQNHWDRDGLLWWTQFGDSTWFDNDAFRANCKTLLAEWVKERRNSPSLILWGLQNESLLPTTFAEECSAIIRDLDPTASTQRLITTCNGGTGTDWDVPQNWSGTYGGDPAKYDDDLRQSSLIGEYGAWRSLGLHTEGGFNEKGPLSEDRFCALMEIKILLAEKASADSCGHFQWPFTSHANPGRNFGELGEQLLDGIRPLDRIGPVNNKGLFTIWGEPTDGFYLYRANFAPKETQPMVYIVSHTWPDRWTSPGMKNGIIVYSNCDEVELFNGSRSLGRRPQSGRGTHLQWEDVEIDCNILRAEARVAGKIVATDVIRLHHLPAPKESSPPLIQPDPTTPIPGQHYLYRINCGGPDYTDSHGNRWLADRDYSSGDTWGASSWADSFGSLRKIYDPVSGTRDEQLFQTFRYGQNQLTYRFALPRGEYTVELFFIEPWYGTGGGLDCKGWRVFDVALNGQTVLHNLDLWLEAGRAHAIKKTITATVLDDTLTLSFPTILSGQAVISAIAISSKTIRPAPNLPPPSITLLKAPVGSSIESHLDTGDRHYTDRDGAFTQLPAELLETDWIKTSSTSVAPLDFTLAIDADLYLAIDDRVSPKPTWLSNWERTSLTFDSNAAPDAQFALYRKSFAKNTAVSLTTACTVFAVRAQPAASPQFITIPDAGREWLAVGNVKPGIRCEALGFDLTRFPVNLTGGDIILPTVANLNKSGLHVHALDHIEIVGAFLPQKPIAENWIDAKQTATASNGTIFALRRQRIAAGSTVAFTPDVDCPVFAFIRSVRPSVTYMPERSPDGRTEWTVQVGVGDRYGLNFNYRNITETTIPVTLEIVQSDGSILRTDPLSFAPSTSKTEWSVLRVRTGASINAGTYTLRIKPAVPDSLQLSTLEVE